MPALRIVTAQARPAGPAPIITASGIDRLIDCEFEVSQARCIADHAISVSQVRWCWIIWRYSGFIGIQTKQLRNTL
jgi:hypothetical protein